MFSLFCLFAAWLFESKITQKPLNVSPRSWMDVVWVRVESIKCCMAAFSFLKSPFTDFPKKNEKKRHIISVNVQCGAAWLRLKGLCGLGGGMRDILGICSFFILLLKQLWDQCYLSNDHMHCCQGQEGQGAEWQGVKGQADIQSKYSGFIQRPTAVGASDGWRAESRGGNKLHTYAETLNADPHKPKTHTGGCSSYDVYSQILCYRLMRDLSDRSRWAWKRCMLGVWPKNIISIEWKREEEPDSAEEL